jgi:hypothetical protein
MLLCLRLLLHCGVAEGCCTCPAAYSELSVRMSMLRVHGALGVAEGLHQGAVLCGHD